jgi:hypothetical protein
MEAADLKDNPYSPKQPDSQHTRPTAQSAVCTRNVTATCLQYEKRQISRLRRHGGRIRINI